MSQNIKPLIAALTGRSAARPPFWLMRQAGRYLPEYRELRKKAENFLDFCYRPELSVEATLQPIRRFGFDAAILFADILLVPQALGADLWFVAGEGPRLSTITSAAGAADLRPADAIHDRLHPVYETVKILSRNLPAQTALIGFAGPRVIEQTVRQKLPEGFQRSEFLLDHGAIDMIVSRHDMRDTLHRLLANMMGWSPLALND